MNRKRKEFVETVYELANGRSEVAVSTTDVCRIMNIDYGTEASEIGHYLRLEEIISWTSFTSIWLTHNGAKFRENIGSPSTEGDNIYIINSKVGALQNRNTNSTQQVMFESDDTSN